MLRRLYHPSARSSDKSRLLCGAGIFFRRVLSRLVGGRHACCFATIGQHRSRGAGVVPSKVQETRTPAAMLRRALRVTRRREKISTLRVRSKIRKLDAETQRRREKPCFVVVFPLRTSVSLRLCVKSGNFQTDSERAEGHRGHARQRMGTGTDAGPGAALPGACRAGVRRSGAGGGLRRRRPRTAGSKPAADRGNRLPAGFAWQWFLWRSLWQARRLPSWGSAILDGRVPYNLLAVVAKVLRSNVVSLTIVESQFSLADLPTIHPESNLPLYTP